MGIGSAQGRNTRAMTTAVDDTNGAPVEKSQTKKWVVDTSYIKNRHSTLGNRESSPKWVRDSMFQFLPWPGEQGMSPRERAGSNSPSPTSRGVASSSSRPSDRFAAKSSAAEAETTTETMANATASILGVHSGPIRPKEERAIRLMQWNVLAEGLAFPGGTGFMLRRLNETDFEGRLAENLVRINQLKEGPEWKDAMNRFKAKERSKEEMKADLTKLLEMSGLLDSLEAERQQLTELLSARGPKITKIIERIMPDIITVQEIDFYTELATELGTLGYTSVGPNTPPEFYESTVRFDKASPNGKTDEVGAFSDHLSLLMEHKVAFAPRRYSTARKFHLLNTKSNSSRMESKSSAAPAGDRLRDDMGVAVFWRAARFNALDVRIAPIGDKTLGEMADLGGEQISTAIRVTLEDVTNGTRVDVATAHLESGTEGHAEAARQQELLRIKERLFSQYGDSPQSLPLILAGDLNSGWHEAPPLGETATSPPIDAAKNCCACVKAEFALRSIWDDMCHEARLPVTSNKIRGPVATDQPQKVGSYGIESIDHVFYNELIFEPTHCELALPLTLKLSQRELEVIKSKAKLTDKDSLTAPCSADDPSITVPSLVARSIPDIIVPSDHLPVVQDFRYRP